MFSQKEVFARASDLLLVPFYLSASLFFVVFQPFVDLPEESVVAAFFKALPVLCLAGFVYKKHLHPNGTDDHYIPSVLIGLLVSSLGDVFMLFRSSLLPLGVFVFSIAHFMYIVGLSGKQDSDNRKSVYLFVNLLVVMFLGYHESIDSTFTKLSLVGYFALLMTVGAMTSCRYEKERSVSALWGIVGAALFILSDTLIVIDTYSLGGGSLECLVMILYYGAQFSFAISTVTEISPEDKDAKDK
ncbi:lysoplasmalogenase-like protein TMEM86A [Haliotis rufescens]|uniref:lysoplasmalogenase-like protein TMEM86A n=1 Tax=Haliotis rufescens TaxID=6454 RepID=UPI00201F2A0F|nr:lysoplasmalogenase-like protein TMEM86A [Haliotis rufescens]